jgi:hypothetical protein
MSIDWQEPDEAAAAAIRNEDNRLARINGIGSEYQIHYINPEDAFIVSIIGTAGANKYLVPRHIGPRIPNKGEPGGFYRALIAIAEECEEEDKAEREG